MGIGAKVRKAAALLVLAGWIGIASPASSVRAADSAATPVSTITGWAVDHKTGKPVADLVITAVTAPRYDGAAVVVAAPVPGDPDLDGAPMAKTDAQGCYRLRLLIPSHMRQTVMLKPAGDVQARGVHGRSLRVDLYQGETVGALPILVANHSALRARIVDEAGKPVAGAQVCPTHGASYYRHFSAVQTDAQGVFSMEANTVGGGVRVSVAAAGYELVDATVRADDPDPVIRLAKRCPVVTGRVLDAAGKPVPNACVFAAPAMNTVPQWSVAADAEGRFRLGTWPRNNIAMEIWPVIDNRQGGFPHKLVPGDREVELTLFATGRIEVSTRDAEGRPLAGVPLWLRCQAKGVEASFPGTTNDQGMFLSGDVPVGSYSIGYSPQGGAARIYEAAEVKVGVEVGQTATAALVCRPAAPPKKEPLPVNLPAIEGLLADADGKPLLHARVGICLKRAGDGGAEQLLTADVLTEADGRFAATLRVFDPRPRARDAAVDKAALEGVTPLAPEGVNQVRISVRLDGDVNRGPAARQRRKAAQLKQAPQDAARVRPDSSPAIVFDITRDWAADAKTLALGRLETRIPAERLALLQVGAPTTRAFPSLERPWAWVVACVDAGNKPAPCRVLAPRTPEEFGLLLAVRTPGPCTVSLENRFGDTRDAAVPAAANQEATVTAEFPPLRSVELVVRDQRGRPVRGMRWYGRGAIQQTSSNYCLDSDKDGKITFFLSSKAAGTYELVGFEGCLGYEQPCAGEITAGEQALVREIRLQDATAELVCRVLDMAGQPARGGKVNLSIALGNVSSSVNLALDEQGFCRTPLPTGAKVKVTARIDAAEGDLVGESDLLTIAAGQKASIEVRLEDMKTFAVKQRARQEEERQKRMQEIRERVSREQRNKANPPPLEDPQPVVPTRPVDLF